MAIRCVPAEEDNAILISRTSSRDQLSATGYRARCRTGSCNPTKCAYSHCRPLKRRVMAQGHLLTSTRAALTLFLRVRSRLSFDFIQIPGHVRSKIMISDDHHDSSCLSRVLCLQMPSVAVLSVHCVTCSHA